MKKYTIYVTQVKDNVVAGRTLIVFAKSNKGAIIKAQELDDDKDWDNFVIGQIEEAPDSLIN